MDYPITVCEDGQRAGIVPAQVREKGKSPILRRLLRQVSDGLPLFLRPNLTADIVYFFSKNSRDGDLCHHGFPFAAGCAAPGRESPESPESAAALAETSDCGTRTTAPFLFSTA